MYWKKYVFSKCFVVCHHCLPHKTCLLFTGCSQQCAPKEFTFKHTLLLKWSVVRKVNSAIYPVVISFETFKIYAVTGKAFLSVYSEASSRLKTLFISSEFSIPSVIALYAFLWQLTKLLWTGPRWSPFV